ncbi:MAG: RIP metalloprotease RseP [Deferribacteres bacterium]|nr:RIP metalloprotease RseP [candidate division KSB1 bacterium]MCB9504145.1 RIP metalloprotease RseP [Deferribacteres bacterium]
MINTIITFVIVLGILVFIHELGHFIFAKLAGIRVERFSLGFPPRMIGKKIGDTDYCISWLPLGGYVKMSGMIDESLEDKLTGEPWEFMSKSLPRRFMAIFAGPAFNYILAVLLFGWVNWSDGLPSPSHPFVIEVTADSPADKAGLKAQDVILSIDEKTMTSVDESISLFSANADNTLQLQILRGEEELKIPVTPEYNEESKNGRIGIAIGQKYTYQPVPFFQSMLYGFEETIHITKRLGVEIGKLIWGEESVKESIAGPIGIAKMVGQAAEAGFSVLLRFMAFLSLQLAILNLLPIPALDGGHIVFILIEAIMKRPPKVKTRMVVQQIGIIFLLFLMVFIIFNDLTR